MAYGPKPKPTAIKIREGNPSKRALPKNEPTPSTAITVPEPYKKLNPAAKLVWRQFAPELHAQNCLTNWDVQEFARYCHAVAEFWEMDALVKKEGLTIETPNGQLMRHPHLTTRNEAAKRAYDLGAKFGLTASDRTRMDVGKQATSGLSEADKFFGYKGTG